MAGAALVQSVCATTPADTQRLARRPRTKDARGGHAAPYAVDGSAIVVIVFVVMLAGSSELRAAIDAQRVAGDPARLVGGEEGHGAGDVVGAGYQRGFASEIGHDD